MGPILMDLIVTKLHSLLSSTVPQWYRLVQQLENKTKNSVALIECSRIDFCWLTEENNQKKKLNLLQQSL